MACGRVRNYLLARNLILLLILPVTYFTYKFGGIPESSVIVNISMFTIAMIVGAKILQSQIQLKFSLFLHEIVLNITIITILSCIIPFLIHIYLDNDIARLIITTLSSIVSTSLLIYIVGLNNKERQFISERIKNHLKKKF